MNKRIVIQTLIFLFAFVLMSNINALVVAVLHPEIPYFDEEHLIVGGFVGAVTGILSVLVLFYMHRTERLLDIRTKNLGETKKFLASEIKAREAGELEWSTALDASEDALYLLDVNRHIIRANKIFYLMTGKSPQTAIGQHIEKIVHPQGEAVPCPVCRAQEELRNDVIIMEPDHPHNIFGSPIEITITVVKDEKEQPVSIFTRLQDLAKQRKIENAIRKSKEEWEKTFDAMSDIVTIQDKDMRIIRANKTAHDFFKVEPGQLNGRHCYEVFRGADSPCPQCPEVETLFDLTQHSGRMTHENLGRTFKVSSDPVFNKKAELKYVVHIAQDITEQRQLEEELFQSQKMEAIGTLAGGIAHDFNNILSAILGYSELAKLDIKRGLQPEENVGQVIVAAKRASDLVKQILTYSRKNKHQLQPIKPHFIVNETLKLMRSSLPTTIRIEQDIAGECGTIRADKTQFHQVIMNLCTNAVHAMHNEKGTLRVSLHQVEVPLEEPPQKNDAYPGSFIVLSVSDTGSGMDEATMKKIFDPYFTTKEIDKGTGLGLAVTHGIVKNCNGFIRVDSKPGAGTTFHLYFPDCQEESPSYKKIGAVQSLPTGNERILFVDDESPLVEINTLILKQLGYTVTGETDSRDALEKVRADPDRFDLIITDMTMPHITGSELAKIILQIKPTMPIILCSGFSSVISEDTALSIGIKKFFAKPILIEQLAEIVRSILDENNGNAAG